jgi:hypothetical protein
LTVVRQIQGNIARVFRTSATPHGFVVDSEGEVAAAGIANSLADLRHLLGDALNEAQRLGRKPPMVSAKVAERDITTADARREASALGRTCCGGRGLA